MADPTGPDLPPRAEVPLPRTCDLGRLFASGAEWEAEAERVAAAIPPLAGFRGRLGEGPATLLEWFAASEAVRRRLGRLTVYADMRLAVDTTDEEAAARYDRAHALEARAHETMAFAEPELLALDPAAVGAWLAAEPRLAHYAHYFDRLARRRAHVRSAEVEELLQGLAEPFEAAGDIHGTLADAELRFAPARGADGSAHAVSQGTVTALLGHPDRKVRQSAWESYADAHRAVRRTMARCLAAGVKQHVYLARARGYPSALEAALGANDIPVAVFDHFVAAFRRHLPTWHRYWRVLRRALGLDRLRVYDIKAPLTPRPPRVPFDDAVAWIAEGLRPLGEDYVATMLRGVRAERWVDWSVNRGKRSGAFSHGLPGTPPYILMSYTDDVQSLSTLAHELGHSMHTYYAHATQPYVYADYSIFVAEVASNFHQALVRAYLFAARPERDFQLALIEEAMSNFHRYLFLMPTLARFELELHQRVERGEPLTADAMSSMLCELFAEGYGGEVEMDHERVGVTWAQFHTHLYANFYVYQYTTGIAGAQVLAEGVMEGRPGAAERYLDFLRAGGSRYPVDALRLAGVDLSAPEPLEHGFRVLAATVDRLESLVG